MKLTKKDIESQLANIDVVIGPRLVGKQFFAKMCNELIAYKNIEDKLGTDLITFLKGINPDTCFMQITDDKQFYFCGDAYYGHYTKESLKALIQNLLFMYWALTKEELQ